MMNGAGWMVIGLVGCLLMMALMMGSMGVLGRLRGRKTTDRQS